MKGKLCRTCGCPQQRHEHYRNGTDCGSCGRAVCPRFRSKRWWQRS